MSNKLTIKQIAELAGVSKSTVSRVLNNHPNIKPELRTKVKKIIDNTGYQRNFAAHSLASNTSKIIGLVIPSVINEVFIDPYYPRLIQGIAQACNEKDYILSLFLFNSPEEEKLVAEQISGNGLFAGMIITADILDDSLISYLMEDNVPFVQVGRPQDVEKVSYADVDNVKGGEIATTHLIELGYQRIAQIATAQNTAGIDRDMGYRQALVAHNFPVDEDLIAYADFSRESGYQAMQKLLPHQPDAVFVQSDTMALGALQALYEVDLSVPDDIAIVGFDDLPPALAASPPLTTIRQPVYETGMLAVELLFDILQNGTNPPRNVISEVELVIRATCGTVQKQKGGLITKQH